MVSTRSSTKAMNTRSSTRSGRITKEAPKTKTVRKAKATPKAKAVPMGKAPSKAKAPPNGKTLLKNKTDSTRKNAKVFFCTECVDRGFTRKSDLQRHAIGHRPDAEKFKQYCTKPGCSYGTMQKGNLKNHMVMHTQSAFRWCLIGDCDFSCTDPSSANRHRKRIHLMSAKQFREYCKTHSIDASPRPTRPGSVHAPTEATSERTDSGYGLGSPSAASSSAPNGNSEVNLDDLIAFSEEHSEAGPVDISYYAPDSPLTPAASPSPHLAQPGIAPPSPEDHITRVVIDDNIPQETESTAYTEAYQRESSTFEAEGSSSLPDRSESVHSFSSATSTHVGCGTFDPSTILPMPENYQPPSPTSLYGGRLSSSLEYYPLCMRTNTLHGDHSSQIDASSYGHDAQQGFHYSSEMHLASSMDGDQEFDIEMDGPAPDFDFEVPAPVSTATPRGVSIFGGRLWADWFAPESSS
ncbi:hypothetical protein CONPUDRAFT_162824 [Coniophora puteana RWD-64-598 SS2]|uniref:C2H2-type domain-containing protein n=1 Tax=Coniophora puteana (strain RWD-64-598) TaxID=741705 RepID=A0A5M3N2Q5_CONPW|nr:uncharacterized protein CONPUDRAFT_162824 [Coniophora puteana RWD-64-598 SS2]EIW85672.1 hypothetical protein CONPUDRAFT_162824 [Coniophora puteana RWD-64-598 SS2]